MSDRKHWKEIRQDWRKQRLIRFSLLAAALVCGTTAIAFPVVAAATSWQTCETDITKVYSSSKEPAEPQAGSNSDLPLSSETTLRNCAPVTLPTATLTMLSVIAVALILPEVIAAAPWLNITTPIGGASASSPYAEASRDIDEITEAFEDPHE